MIQIQCYDEVTELFRQVLTAEIDGWVPNASQRLIYRVGEAMGVPQPQPGDGVKDCGPGRSAHALIPDWVAGLYVMRCSTCFHVYAV